MEDAFTMLRLLARSATGQEFSTYTTFVTGPRREGELDGPNTFHVVLVDNGRTDLVGTEFQDILRCIRCGACLNHCPVFGAIGGQAYGWVYSGPMGAVLTPALTDLQTAHHLPYASCFCARCEEVCPMHIPLPKMMRHWRERAFKERINLTRERLIVRCWTFIALHPKMYRLISNLAASFFLTISKKSGWLPSLPLFHGWTYGRDLPAPEEQTFHALWRSSRRTRESQ